MKLDVTRLESVYEMAHDGAQLAATRFANSLERDARVRNTRVTFGTQPETAIDGRSVAVGIDLDGVLDGRCLVEFDESIVATIQRTLVGGQLDASDPALGRSALLEFGAVLNNGFVDGWADAFDADIDVSPPSIEAADFSQMQSTDTGPLELAFWSQIDTVDHSRAFTHCFVPTADCVERLVSGESGDRTIEASALSGFETLLENGVASMSDTLTEMTGIEAETPTNRMEFISLDRLPARVSTGRYRSVAFSFHDTPSGYLLFLFDRDGATTLVRELFGDSTGNAALARDAIQELANVMTSSLLDGWANVLETAIDHSTPAYTEDMGAAVIDPLVVGLSEHQEFAFVFSLQLRSSDPPIELDIYTIPDEDDLLRALRALETKPLEGVAQPPSFTPTEATPTAFAVGELIESDHP
ncbi:chemotaxis protein CheC [Halocatena halophila]|uniref:chemotaxis protein CheC n=1 Tax=Halocatena halophila TaxID=2814576 RepID=UPI002ECFDD1C